MPDVTFRHVPGMKTASAVPILEADRLSERVFVDEYVSRSRPCVIRKGAAHWAAIEKWRDREYLKRRAGHHQVFLYPGEYHTSTKRMEKAGKRLLTLNEAIDYLHASDTEIGIVITGQPSELEPDIGGFSFLKETPLGFCYPTTRYFFYRNAGTTWHYHSFDETLMCQMVGSKKIGLLDVNNPSGWVIRNMFLFEDYYDDPSAFDAFDGTGLQWFEASLDPGDALYIPPLWWHGIVTTTTTFGSTASICWQSPPHIIADSLRKMAVGEADIIGKPGFRNAAGLHDVARRMGLERELGIAWQRGI